MIWLRSSFNEGAADPDADEDAASPAATRWFFGGEAESSRSMATRASGIANEGAADPDPDEDAASPGATRCFFGGEGESLMSIAITVDLFLSPVLSFHVA
eukprot:13425488-Heterocapsa_arctica.AAC.1